MESNKCPDFDLAPMEHFDPNILMTYKVGQESLEELDAFIITLGLIFNDLKGLFWWNEQLEKCPSKDISKTTEYLGQWMGMKIQINRLLLGLFVEMLNTINKNEKILKQPLFLKTLRSLKTKPAKNWIELVDAAKYKNSPLEKNKKLFSLVQEIRSNGVFHYENIGEIHKGYKAHFKENITGVGEDFHKKAYLSLGESIFKTRFYFSDAAVDAYSILKGKKFHSKYNDLNISQFITEKLKNINISIRFIIEKYIDLRRKYND